MGLQHAAIVREIETLVASGTRIADGMRRVIELCERDVPHPDWQRLRAIDYAADVPRLRAWCDRLLESTPPEVPLHGLFFDVCQPVVGEGRVTTDLELVGTTEYDSEDPDLEWLFSGIYRPDAYAESRALDELYGIAYGTHGICEEREGVLGNDAEWPLGLAFGVLVAVAIIEDRAFRARWVGPRPAAERRRSAFAGRSTARSGGR